MSMTELWIDRNDYRNTRVIQQDQAVLEDGQIRVAIDKFALTANNVSYAASGDMIGYWNFFPTGEEPWGKVTVWGMADVVESNSAEIEVGERLYGFLPMSTELILRPGRVRDENFMDVASHRKELPALYNQYSRTRAEPPEMQAIEDERCVFFPLFITGYVIADFLEDNNWFGAEQVIVGSASSTTGYGLAKFIRENNFGGKVVGLTSGPNMGFVNDLGLYNEVVEYDSVEGLSNVPSVDVDMAGDQPLRARLHHYLKDNMKNSQFVGMTHWEAGSVEGELPGARPEFFFAPAQIDKRNADWGVGVLAQKGGIASAALAMELKELLKMERHDGAEACAQVWRDMLDNKISGRQGIMVSLRAD
ncbi:DUF2855 family protein [Porticoccus sp.]|uniref:DUF2855 family protein n=1 Tax=Porticoccus sp. TaxID=2024853 RepID=UPI003F69F30F